MSAHCHDCGADLGYVGPGDPGECRWCAMRNENERLRDEVIVARFDASVAMTERDAYMLSTLMTVRQRVSNLGGFEKPGGMYVKQRDVLSILAEVAEITRTEPS